MSSSDRTFAGLCLLAQVMLALTEYGDRLRDLERRMYGREYIVRRRELRDADPNRRGPGRPKGSRNKPKLSANGLGLTGSAAEPVSTTLEELGL